MTHQHIPTARSEAIFIPGYGARGQAALARYDGLIANFEEEVGWNVTTIPWERTLVVDEMASIAASAYLEKSQKHPFMPVHFIGFSMGCAAIIRSVEMLERRGRDEHICTVHLNSMSPVFGKYYERMDRQGPGIPLDPHDNDWILLGVGEEAGLNGAPLPQLHKHTHIYIGDNEWPIMHAMARYAADTWGKFAHLHHIPQTGHRAEANGYIETVRRILGHATGSVMEKRLDPLDLVSVNWQYFGLGGADNPGVRCGFTRQGSVAVENPDNYTTIALDSWYCFLESVKAGDHGDPIGNCSDENIPSVLRLGEFAAQAAA